MTRSLLPRIALVLVFALACATGGACAEDAPPSKPPSKPLIQPLIQNGDFKLWEGGTPTSWTTEIGARNGYASPTNPTNTFSPLEGGGVASTGHAKVIDWRILMQRFAAKPGESFKISCRTRGVGLKREGHQYDNCWVGAFFKDAAGRRLAFPMVDVHGADWSDGFLHVRAPGGTAYGEVGFFCSTSGRFEVTRLDVRRVDPQESFDVLVEDMDRYYSFFAAHKIDWPALVEKHRPAATAATTPAAFAKAITPLLAELQDGHIWVDTPERGRSVPWAPKVATNFELPAALARLTSKRQVISNVMAGRTKEGYGYLVIGSMAGSRPQLAQLDGAWRSLFDAPAIVLDLRVNGGGQEVWGQKLLGCLTQTSVAYGTAKVRGGPKHDQFRDGGTRYVNARPKERYRGEVIALIGPGCVSSGEGMAMMLKALGVTLVGQTTRGSSGNPAPVVLPNGVTVWYSRWQSFLPDGSPLERHGVAPDVVVKHERGKDDTFDKALEILRKRLPR